MAARCRWIERSRCAEVTSIRRAGAASPVGRRVRGLALAALLLAGNPAFAAGEPDALDDSARVRFLGLLVGHPDAPALSLLCLDDAIGAGKTPGEDVADIAAVPVGEAKDGRTPIAGSGLPVNPTQIEESTSAGRR